MRFSAPRSVSPSPEREGETRTKSKTKARKQRTPSTSRTSPQQRRHPSTFGLNPFEESESEDDGELDSESVGESVPESDSDSDSFCYDSDSEVPQSQLSSKSPRLPQSSKEQSQIQETIAAIRLRTRHHDPYEEWEREMRKDSLRTARKAHASSLAALSNSRSQRAQHYSDSLLTKFRTDTAEVNRVLETLRLRQSEDEKHLQERLKQRDANLWARVEHGIKLDEAKEQARRDEERRILEEKERRRREEEEAKRKKEEEARREEERLRKEAEEAQRRKEDEERREREENERSEQEKREREERLKAEGDVRKATGMTTPEDDFREARKNLMIAKTQGTRFVKANQSLKPMWTGGRRNITAKIGQLTNDEATINRVSSNLISILIPQQSHPPQVYTALLSSLAKALVLQAETEITAEKRSAIPLAKVTVRCLEALEGLSEVLFAKMMQRIGCWVIPCSLPPVDFDDTPWKNGTNGPEQEQERIRKVLGYRKNEEDVMETQTQYTERVMGVMRLYFEVLRIPPERGPLKGMFQLPRYWIWMARMLGERRLLETSTGAEIVYVALDVLGADALQIWGYQFVKVLRLLYDGATEGLEEDGMTRKLLGGSTPDGIAARARVKLEVEGIMKGVR